MMQCTDKARIKMLFVTKPAKSAYVVNRGYPSGPEGLKQGFFSENYKPPVNEPIGSYQIQHLMIEHLGLHIMTMQRIRESSTASRAMGISA